MLLIHKLPNIEIKRFTAIQFSAHPQTTASWRFLRTNPGIKCPDCMSRFIGRQG